MPTGSLDISQFAGMAGGSGGGTAGAVGGILDIAGSYVNAFSKGPDSFNSPEQTGFGSRHDLGAIGREDFDGKQVDYLATVKGAQTGAQLGGPVGAAIGGAVGLGATLSGVFMNQKRKREFEKEKSRRMRNSMSVNSALDKRDIIMRNYGRFSRSNAY